MTEIIKHLVLLSITLWSIQGQVQWNSRDDLEVLMKVAAKDQNECNSLCYAEQNVCRIGDWSSENGGTCTLRGFESTRRKRQTAVNLPFYISSRTIFDTVECF